MNANIRPATEHGPGHAWLVTTAPLPDGSMLLIVNESETNRYLGPDGWQPVPAQLPLADVESSGAGSRALLGPDICDWIKDSEYITVSLDEREIYADFWPTIVPMGSRNGSAGRFGMGAPAPKDDVPPEVTPKPAPPPKPHVVETPPLVPPNRPKSHGALLGSLAAVGLVCGLVLLALLRPDLLPENWRFWEEGQTATAPAAPAPAPAPGSGAEWSPAEPSAPAGADSDLALGPDGWRRLLADPATDPARLYSLGRILRERPDADANIGFEAIYEAGRRGNSDALVWYGRANDPTVPHAAGESVEAPNIRRALEAYKAAQAAGSTAAAADLARVCDHLRPKRFSGSPVERTSFQDHCS